MGAAADAKRRVVRLLPSGKVVCSPKFQCLLSPSHQQHSAGGQRAHPHHPGAVCVQNAVPLPKQKTFFIVSIFNPCLSPRHLSFFSSSFLLAFFISDLEILTETRLIRSS